MVRRLPDPLLQGIRLLLADGYHERVLHEMQLDVASQPTPQKEHKFVGTKLHPAAPASSLTKAAGLHHQLCPSLTHLPRWRLMPANRRLASRRWNLNLRTLQPFLGSLTSMRVQRWPTPSPSSRHANSNFRSSLMLPVPPEYLWTQDHQAFPLVRAEVAKEKVAARRVEKSKSRIIEPERDMVDAKALLKAVEELRSAHALNVAELSVQLTSASSKDRPPITLATKIEGDQVEQVAGQALTAMHDNINAICATQAIAMQAELTRILAIVSCTDAEKQRIVDEASKSTTFHDTFIAEMEVNLKSQTEEAAGALLKKARLASAISSAYHNKHMADGVGDHMADLRARITTNTNK